MVGGGARMEDRGRENGTTKRVLLMIAAATPQPDHIMRLISRGAERIEGCGPCPKKSKAVVILQYGSISCHTDLG